MVFACGGFTDGDRFDIANKFTAKYGFNAFDFG